MSHFTISETNPNDQVGGGGTLTSGETASEDSQGPYIVFPAIETASNISPHAVLSFDAFQEIAAVLEAEVTEPEVIEVPEADVEEIPEV